MLMARHGYFVSFGALKKPLTLSVYGTEEKEATYIYVDRLYHTSSLLHVDEASHAVRGQA